MRLASERVPSHSRKWRLVPSLVQDGILEADEEGIPGLEADEVQGNPEAVLQEEQGYIFGVLEEEQGFLEPEDQGLLEAELEVDQSIPEADSDEDKENIEPESEEDNDITDPESEEDKDITEPETDDTLNSSWKDEYDTDELNRTCSWPKTEDELDWEGNPPVKRVKRDSQ